MNNIELEQKIKEIIAIENYFDMKIAMNDFESEYKKTDFYKKTKISLVEVVREARIHYTLQLDNIGEKLQRMINSLSLEKFTEILDQLGQTFGTENSEIGEMINTLKELR